MFLFNDIVRYQNGLIEDLYLKALARPPTSKEKNAALELLGGEPTEDALQDVLWAVFMLPEFQLIY